MSKILRARNEKNQVWICEKVRLAALKLSWGNWTAHFSSPCRPRETN